MPRPDGSGNLPGNTNVVAAEIYIERDQERPSTYGNRACCFVNAREANVGCAFWLKGNLFSEEFKGPTTHVFQIDAIRSPGCTFIEINRYRKFASNPVACRVSQHSAIIQRHSANGNKRQYVRGPKPRVNPRVHAHVNQLRCPGDRPDSCLDDKRR